MKLLIDADIITYILASACNNNQWNYQGTLYTSKKKVSKIAQGHEDEILFQPDPEPIEVLEKTINSYMDELLSYLPMYDYTLFLTSKGNFRNNIATILPYKGNRDGKIKPFHFQNVRDYLLRYYNAQLSHPSLETDDEISMRSDKEGRTIICSTDKDFLQLEGMHFNLTTRECSYVDSISALRNFYTQVLLGDTADNIPGVYGIGPKSVYVKTINMMEEEEDMYKYCLEVYLKHYRGYAEDFLIENIMLLYLVRNEEAYWKESKYLKPDSTYWKESA